MITFFQETRQVCSFRNIFLSSKKEILLKLFFTFGYINDFNFTIFTSFFHLFINF